MLDTQDCFQNNIKNVKTTKFLFSTLPKDSPAKFYVATTFALGFMISPVAPIAQFYA